MKLLNCVHLFATPWTVASQAPPSMEYSRQEYWSGLPFPSSGEHRQDSTVILSTSSASLQSLHDSFSQKNQIRKKKKGGRLSPHYFKTTGTQDSQLMK